MPASDTEILLDVSEGIAHLRLNRPEKFNCVSAGLLDALDHALARIETEDAIRVVLLTANGKHFCTGADLDEAGAARRSAATMQAFIEHGHRVFRRLECLPKPTVAAVHGLALAGGLELVMSCDVVFMSASAKVGDQHAQYGLYPGWGNSARLPRAIGRRRAIELMYSARWLDATEAREFGIANYVVGDAELAEQTRDYARMLATRNPGASAFMKAMSLSADDETLAAALAREATGAAAGLLSDNVGEGLAAFQARRKPEFR